MLGTSVNLSFMPCLRPSVFFGSMPLTACSMTRSGVLGHGLGEGLGLQSARMTGVMVVDLVQLLRAGHANLVRVDDDHEVAGVHVRRVLRLVLAFRRVAALVATRPRT